MPNWCYNAVEIGGDVEELNAFAKFLDENNGKNWFDFFRPMPKEVGDAWYEWAVNHWGCKWNCDAISWDRTDDVVSVVFDSPWSPPIALYEFLTEQGYDVDAHYHEEGMAFVGRFLDGNDETYEYDLSDPDTLDYIPDEIIDYWDLRTRLEEYQEENGEDDDEE